MAETEATFMEEILAERRRQVKVEGWTPDHDDDHEYNVLLQAGVYYLNHGTKYEAPLDEDGVPMGWPWEPKWWKPKDRHSNLIRAGALIMAERDSRIRHGAHDGGNADHWLCKVLSARALLSPNLNTGEDHDG